MTFLKPAVYLFAVVGFVFVALNLYVNSGLVHSCDVQNLAAVRSPGNQHEAKLQIKRCNYQSDPMVTLSISSKANATQEDAADVGVATTTDFDLTWVSDQRLQISYPQSFDFTQAIPALGGIDIDWNARPPPGTSFVDGLDDAVRQQSNP